MIYCVTNTCEGKTDMMTVCIDSEATGKQIRDMRCHYGISINRLSEMLGVTIQSVYKWEKGNNLPDITNLLLLSKILDTTVEDILVVIYRETL